MPVTTETLVTETLNDRLTMLKYTKEARQRMRAINKLCKDLQVKRHPSITMQSLTIEIKTAQCQNPNNGDTL